LLVTNSQGSSIAPSESVSNVDSITIINWEEQKPPKPTRTRTAIGGNLFHHPGDQIVKALNDFLLQEICHLQQNYL
jgi:hypothetical protein